LRGDLRRGGAKKRRLKEGGAEKRRLEERRL
jgi:hypothetical protein